MSLYFFKGAFPNRNVTSLLQLRIVRQIYACLKNCVTKDRHHHHCIVTIHITTALHDICNYTCSQYCYLLRSRFPAASCTSHSEQQNLLFSHCPKIFDDMSHPHERSALVVSLFLFSISAYWKLRSVRKDKEDKACCTISTIQHTVPVDGAKVSSRCIMALKPYTAHADAFRKALSYQCHEAMAPDGYISLSLAENKLGIDLLAERLMNSGTTTAAFSDSTVYGYNSFVGLPVARQAAAYFIAKRFYKPDAPSLAPDMALAAINPENIGIGAGATGILNSLFYLLGEAGDACLVPAPYYRKLR